MITIKGGIKVNGRTLGGATSSGPGGFAREFNLMQSFGVMNYVDSGQFLADVAERAVERVKLRTRQGTDAEGAAFKEYSPRYRKQKEKYGRYRGKVDLYLSGSMLNAMAFFPGASPLKGALRVRDFTLPGRKVTAGELARIHTLGEGRMPKREWFAWKQGSQEDQKLLRVARNLMARAMRQRQRAAYGVPVFTSKRGVGTELT